jgi:histone-lysine N-methyltransferase SETMAR
MIAAISDLMRENRRIAISKTAMEMKTGVVSAHTIVAEELYYRNVSERCIPRRLTPEIKKRRRDVCRCFSHGRSSKEGLLKGLITGDESYVHFFTPECKRASSEWRHQNSPRMKKVRSEASAGKVLFTLVWENKGVILEHYLVQRGYAVAQLVEALRYKPKGRGFDSRWCH